MVDAAGITALTNILTTSSAANAGAANLVPIVTNVLDVPNQVQELLRQIQLNATVTALPTDNTLVVSTPMGSFTLALAQLSVTQQQTLTQQLLSALQSGRPLSLLVAAGSPPVQAVLLMPSTGNLDTNPAPLSSNPSMLNSTVASQDPIQPITITPGTSLTAIVLPPAAVSNAPVATPNLAPVPPVIQPMDNLSLMQPETGLPALLQPISESDQAPPGVSNILQVGASLAFNVDQVVPPNAGPLPIAQNANQLVATVAGVTPNGQFIFTVNDTSLYVKQNISVDVGTSLLLTVASSKATDLTVLPKPDSASLSNLQQAMATLAQLDPALATQVMDMRIPMPNNAMTGALLFLMSSFKQAGLSQWLGDDAVNSLTHAGKYELIAKLGQDLANAGQDAQDPVVGEWKAFNIPIHVNEQFQMINFYVHNNRDRPFSKGSPTQPASGYLRFLIDMRMSKLGLLQLDGLIQPKKLDMIVRSEQALPDGLHHELRDNYIKSLSSIDYMGSLSFQVGHKHWLNIQRKTEKAAMVT